MPSNDTRTVQVDGRGEVIVPAEWSDNAATILAKKYCRSYKGLFNETSAKRVFTRLVEFWTDDKDIRGELYTMLMTQRAAPNSPQFFNGGIYKRYHIGGSDIGLWYWHVDEARSISTTYQYPQLHACFLQPVEDSIPGIAKLLTNEAKLFQRGSGTGTNFSSLRATGERLSGGGASSGVISYLKVFDAMAGAIKSGGTRRSAKMVILDIDHPDIEEFINWKEKEEKKAKTLIKGGYSSDWEGEAYQTVSGQNSNNSVRVTDTFMNDVVGGVIPDHKVVELKGRVDDTVDRTVKVSDLWRQICESAHRCADPGLIFGDTVNAWNTTPRSGEIRTCNPCAEHWRLDNSACNLASINLGKFSKTTSYGGQYVGKVDELTFDSHGFMRAVELFITVLDSSVDLAGYPSKEICETTQRFRDLGLGYANLGGMLMSLGIAYDSAEGRHLAAAVTSMMTATAYCMSAKLAKEKGAYPEFKRNRVEHLNVLQKHKSAHDTLYIESWHIDNPLVKKLIKQTDDIWTKAEQLAEKYGQRNAQTTVIAPTGTIALLMDCDTTGIEPAFALRATKQVAKQSADKEGGQNMTLTIGAVKHGLQRLGYDRLQVQKALDWVADRGHLNDPDSPISSVSKPVFHTAMHGLVPEAHIRMVGACQPFVAGGISKTINMPNEATVEHISNAYIMAYEKGLKCISIYRDGSKSQPLTADCKTCGDDEACLLEA